MPEKDTLTFITKLIAIPIKVNTALHWYGIMLKIQMLLEMLEISSKMERKCHYDLGRTLSPHVRSTKKKCIQVKG